MPFQFTKMEIPEVILITPKVFKDNRGFFMESYKKSDFQSAGIPTEFVQDNRSKSKKGVLRGLHFQEEPSAQGKLVQCLLGRIFDVAVDIREDSPHYTQWVSAELSEDNRKLLWIPPGFAHGFVALEDRTEVGYKTTEEYDPQTDGGILWNDPEIGVLWPVEKPILSAKDLQLPLLKDL